MTIAMQQIESIGWVERSHSASDQCQIIIRVTESGRGLWLTVSRVGANTLRWSEAAGIRHPEVAKLPPVKAIGDFLDQIAVG